MKRRDHWQHWLGQVFPDCEDVEQPYKFPNLAGESIAISQLSAPPGPEGVRVKTISRPMSCPLSFAVYGRI